MHLLINELSFIAQAHDREHAGELMEDLIEVIRLLKPIQGEAPICTSNLLWQKEIYQGLSVYQWMNEMKQAKRVWFMKVVRNGPHIETLLDEYYHECWFQDEEVTSTSLAGAACFEGILTSLQHCARFNTEKIHLRYREDKKEEFIEVTIPNACNSENTKTIVEEIINTDLSEVSSWNEFWERKNIFFPCLSFCDCVQKQLDKLDFIQMIKIVKAHLAKMNAYCKKIKTDDKMAPDYTEMGIDASGESACTLDRFGYQRIFTCPDGNDRLFEWHSKQRGQNLRIHFYPPDNDCKDFLIGYIGPHLDTWKYH